MNLIIVQYVVDSHMCHKEYDFIDYSNGLTVVLAKTPNTIVCYNYRIPSNKRRASNKCHPVISAALLAIHIEISASF